MAIPKKNISRLNKALQIKKRTSGLKQDFEDFEKQIEKEETPGKQINLKQKLSAEEIERILNQLAFKKEKPNVYHDQDTYLTIKPLTTLFQLIRLFGHAKYLKGEKQATPEKIKEQKKLIPRFFRLF